MDEFWALETLGIKDSPLHNEDEFALEQFNNTIYFSENRYHVTWPWKVQNPELPDNFSLAYGRLRSLLRRITPDLFSKIDAIIKDQLVKGIIEPVDTSVPTEHLIHYIPHQPVLTLQKTTTKCRIVYDASAKLPHKNSLNDLLIRGPVILPNLIGLLIQFRLGKIGLVSDVEKAFLQIVLQPSQRDVTRFLWVTEQTQTLNPQLLQIFRFTRVPFGMTSSPFLLGATIQYHLKHSRDPDLQELTSNFYVDNMVLSVDSAETAMKIYQKATQSFALMGMNLREWNSNSVEVKNQISKEKQSEKSQDKILGILWDTNKDTIQLTDRNQIQLKPVSTKRQALSVLSEVYDPLGLIAPVTLLGKKFIQDLWTQKLDWDETLSEEQLTAFDKLIKVYTTIHEITLPRWISFTVTTKCELHIFTDASATAYACAAYLRFYTNDTWKT